jgi:hypothetical protein
MEFLIANWPAIAAAVGTGLVALAALTKNKWDDKVAKMIQSILPKVKIGKK